MRSCYPDVGRITLAELDLHIMSLLANVLGFSAFGFATRCLQLGIQKKHMFHGAYQDEQFDAGTRSLA